MSCFTHLCSNKPPFRGCINNAIHVYNINNNKINKLSDAMIIISYINFMHMLRLVALYVRCFLALAKPIAADYHVIVCFIDFIQLWNNWANNSKFKQ